MRFKLLLACLAMLCAAAALSQDCIYYDDYLHRIGLVDYESEYPNGMAKIGQTLLIAHCYDGMARVDASDPYAMVALPSFDTLGCTEDVAVMEDWEDLVSVADGFGGLSIWDTAFDPPVLYGSLDLGEWCDNVACSPHFSSLTGENNSLIVVDTSDASHPELHGEVHLTGRGYDVAIGYSAPEYYAFVAQSDYWFSCVRIEADEPAEVGRCAVMHSPKSIAVADGFVYVGCYAGNDGALEIFEMISVHEFVPRGDLELDDTVQSIHVEGDYAYLGCENAGVRVVDISDPDNPVVVGVMPTLHESQVFCVDGSYAYSAGENWDEIKLEALHLGNRMTPEPENFFAMPGCPTDLDEFGGLIGVTDYCQGFFVVEADPFAILGSCALPFDPYKSKIVGDYAYCWGHGDGKFCIVDLSDPYNPTPRGWLEGLGSGCGLAVMGDYVYYCGSGDGLQIIDCSDVDNPLPVGNYDEGGSERMIEISGDHAYLFAGGNLQVLDLTDPLNPVFLVEDPHDTSGEGYEMRIVDHYLYYTMRHEFGIFDISDPTDPVLLDHVYLYQAFDFVLHNHHVYTFGYGNGVAVFDILDHTNIVRAGNMTHIESVNWNGINSGCVIGDKLIISDEFGGLWEAPLDCEGVTAAETPAPAAPALSSHPNPFNPVTTCRFALAQDGPARLSVHDVSGRQLVLLAEGWHRAGEHQLAWDGRDDAGRELPSGLYLLRLVTEQGLASQKLTLLK